MAPARVVMAALKSLAFLFGRVDEFPKIPPDCPGTIWGVRYSLCLISLHLVSLGLAQTIAMHSFTSPLGFHNAASCPHTKRRLNSIAADVTVSPSSVSGCGSSDSFSLCRIVSLLRAASQTAREISSTEDASLASIVRMIQGERKMVLQNWWFSASLMALVYHSSIN